MVHAGRRRAAGAIGTAALAGAMLAGCAHRGDRNSAPLPPPPPAVKKVIAPAPPPVAAGSAATPGRLPRQRYEVALQLMQQGDIATARNELVALLKDRPGDRRAQSLLTQIDVDPRQIYGRDSFTYTIQVGDTLFSLSRRFLRNPLNFYGLARFNNLTLPVDLQPGQQILIPGHPRAPERATAPRRPSGATTAPGVPTPAPETPAHPAVTASARREAQQLRQRGLEQMSAGSIDRAVTLLSQATSLDPDNGAIAADLSRARRIQATVHSR